MEKGTICLLGFPLPQILPAAQTSCSSLQAGLSPRTRQITASKISASAFSWGFQKDMKSLSSNIYNFS